jgi:hypothetical protein
VDHHIPASTDLTPAQIEREVNAVEEREGKYGDVNLGDVLMLVSIIRQLQREKQELHDFAMRFYNRVCERTAQGLDRCTTAWPTTARGWCDGCISFNLLTPGLALPKP